MLDNLNKVKYLVKWQSWELNQGSSGSKVTAHLPPQNSFPCR